MAVRHARQHQVDTPISRVRLDVTVDSTALETYLKDDPIILGVILYRNLSNFERARTDRAILTG